MIENNSLCAIYLFIKRIFDYEPEIFYQIKGYLFYQFKSNQELRRVVSIIFWHKRKNYKHMIKLNRIRMEYKFKYGPMTLWNTSQITDMSHLFQDMKLKNVKENCIKNWDISKVENMEEMFQNCTLSKDLSYWDLSKVKNTTRMFDKCIIVKN
tara:strand:+ start:4534 stop:4992 length:459 start_codon:yes stop_codon:yes gene_type:complete